MKTNPASLRAPAKAGLLLVVGVVFLGPRAYADDAAPIDPSTRAATVSRLSDEGVELFKARDYRHANEKFLQAYALDQDPNLLFNMARCHEALGERDSAIEKYETFLAKPDADAQGKRRATAAIRNLRQAKTKGAEAAQAAPGGAASQENDPAHSGHAVGRENGSFLSPPVVVLGSGVLVTAMGAVVYAMGAADHRKVTDSPGYGAPGQVDAMTEAQARQLVKSGDTKKLIGGITLGLGGALLATSAVLFIVGTPSQGHTGKDTGAVAFGIAPTRAGGGQLLLEGRF